MIYYAIAALAPLFTWYVGELMKKSNRRRNEVRDTKWLTYLGVLPMFLLFVLRNNHVGADTVGYVDFFQNQIPKIKFNELFIHEFTEGIEPGHLIFVKLISLITDNYTIYFLINALVIFGSLIHFANKHTKNPSLFFFFFVTLGTYNFILTGLRQSFAISICLWAVDFIKEKKLVPFLLLVWLASQFHKSAWIFALAYPMCRLKRTDYLVASYVVLTAVFVVGFSFFQNLINQWLGYGYGVESTGNGMIFLVLLTAMFLFAVYTIDDSRPGMSEDSVPFHLAAITVVLWVLRLISRTVERVSYYFIPGLYAYFATSVSVERNKFIGVIKWLFIAAAFALHIYRSIGVYYAFCF